MFLRTFFSRLRLFVFMGMMITPLFLSAQSPRDQQLEEKMVKEFNAGRYKEALPDVRELLSRYPKDPLYNYYNGVCLVSLNQEPEKAITSLRLASLAKVPSDVFFYLGKASYQQDDYTGAIKYFEQFRGAADARTRESYHLERWINLCQLYLRNPDHNIPGANTQAAYREMLDQAMKYQHKLDSVSYLLKKEEQKTGMVKEKQDRIAVLTEEQKYYTGEVNKYFTEVRRMETSGNTVIREDQIRGNVMDTLTYGSRGGSPYLENVGDQFYRLPGISSVFDPPDQQRLDDFRKTTAKGNALMEKSFEVNSEIEKQTVVVNGARSKKESQQARKTIDRLEKDKMALRMEAITYFQEVNDAEFALYNKYIERLLQTGNYDEPTANQGRVYQEEALKSRRKALSLRDKAGQENNKEKRFDRLMEGNAYELIALDNQKKSIGTLTGLVPVAGKNVDILRPVADISRATNHERSVAVKTDTSKQEMIRDSGGNTSSVSGQQGNRLSETGSEDNKPSSTESAGKTRADLLNKFPFGFAVRSSIPYDALHPIPVLDNLPEGVNYKIQVAAFNNEPELSYFKGMYPLSKEEIPGKNLKRYYAGLFRKYDNALKALLQIRKMGFPDALIVGFYNGERSSLERIRWLEDELPYENISGSGLWSNDKNTGGQVRVDQGKGSFYRVQLGAFRKPLTDDKIARLRNYTGEKDLIISRTDKGTYVYSIGNFLTFEEAASVKTTLLNEGVEGVFVTSWKDGKRIPIEEKK